MLFAEPRVVFAGLVLVFVRRRVLFVRWGVECTTSAGSRAVRTEQFALIDDGSGALVGAVELGVGESEAHDEGIEL